MWGERQEFEMAVRNKTLVKRTRLNCSLTAAESQNTGMFLKHRRTNRRKPNLPVAVWCFHFSLFTHWHFHVWRLISVGAGHTGDPGENVLETFFGIYQQVLRRHWHMLTRLSPSTNHSHLSTENKLSFVWHPERVSCPFLYQRYEMTVSLQQPLGWGMAWQVIGWLTGLSGQLLHLRLSSNKI